MHHPCIRIGVGRRCPRWSLEQYDAARAYVHGLCAGCGRPLPERPREMGEMCAECARVLPDEVAPRSTKARPKYEDERPEGEEPIYPSITLLVRDSGTPLLKPAEATNLTGP